MNALSLATSCRTELCISLWIVMSNHVSQVSQHPLNHVDLQVRLVMLLTHGGWSSQVNSWSKGKVLLWAAAPRKGGVGTAFQVAFISPNIQFSELTVLKFVKGIKQQCCSRYSQYDANSFFECVIDLNWALIKQNICMKLIRYFCVSVIGTEHKDI